MTILEPIFAQQPDAPAVIADGKVVSFGELCSDVLRAAAYLTSLGLDEKSAIGIGIGTYGGDGSDYASWIAHLASIRIGAAHASIPDPASLDALVEGSALDLLLGKL